MKILIGSAWPYANGSLHIGHLAALLPADVIARLPHYAKDLHKPNFLLIKARKLTKGGE